MDAFDAIAERRIQEALARGDFDDLPGAGKPLDLSEDPLVPEDLRMAYRILRNAGFVPPEVEQLRDLRDLERCIAESEDDAERAGALRRLQLLALRLAESGRGRGAFAVGSPYHAQLVTRFA